MGRYADDAFVTVRNAHLLTPPHALEQQAMIEIGHDYALIISSAMALIESVNSATNFL